ATRRAQHQRNLRRAPAGALRAAYHRHLPAARAGPARADSGRAHPDTPAPPAPAAAGGRLVEPGGRANFAWRSAVGCR
nr:hypothetical protein [Tanacetum cinerariifolium]